MKKALMTLGGILLAALILVGSVFLLGWAIDREHSYQDNQRQSWENGR